MKKKILLHVCCAPCASSPVIYLSDNYEISFYWFNPNIYDNDEYQKRKDSALRYAETLGIKFFEEKNFIYDYDKWLEKGGENCDFCYKLRLSKTAEFAKNNGFAVFSTSLLSSPYQNHELASQYGLAEAQKNAIEFLYFDFRPKYYDGLNSLRKDGYYIQKYCGCAKSKREREEQIKAKEKKKLLPK